MIKILVIADDLTGALDTGVKFSDAGALTKVITDTEMNFDENIVDEVLVFCAPTRHLSPRDAYEMIYRITKRAVAAKVECIYKKTDSAMRGNIGAELSAVLDGSGEDCISFIPALPAMDRVTVEGVHYIDGVPVDKSVFGQDPFEPVTESYVPDLIGRQCNVPVRVVSSREAENFRAGDEKCIYVFDCVSKEDMENEVRILKNQGRMKVLAGCAGLAESLPPYLGLNRAAGRWQTENQSHDRLIVICGSVNPISCRQMDHAEQRGWSRIHIPEEQLLSNESLLENSGRALIDSLLSVYHGRGRLIIDSLKSGKEQILEGTADLTLETIRQRISRRMGLIMKAMMDREEECRFMIIGGDTLLAFLEAICCYELTPVCELRPGVILSRVSYKGQWYDILSKSGGFGKEDLLATFQEKTENREENDLETAVS